MHLKSLELVGFKSFAERTLMEFGPGMTSVVGPNGCGKSNVSDAVRWVLGEQSAKLLRGSKMEDCIFNGTDNRKPLSMAEVSLTLANCENTLQTEYHEITVTRRVFRSGEGQYFINKTPCRLKDIQRLFMDTGIGTSSYSLMEQGRIDLILSSRPEDRREIFEEASGITKYKTDKREAMRKLDQTEANLLRLADIIKEVKRQIISLQRQAGKAVRVKKLRQELRSLDIYISHGKLQTNATELQRMETQMAAINETVEAYQKDIADLEQKSQALRQALAESENEMDVARQSEMELSGRLQQTQKIIEIDRRRIEELQTMIERESGDHDSSTRDIDIQRRSLEQTRQLLDQADAVLAACEQDLRDKSGKNADHEQLLDQAKQTIENLHSESMELDDKLAKLQNEYHQMEINDRALVGKRERYAAEQTSLGNLLESQEKRLTGLSTSLKKLLADVTQAEEQLAMRQNERTDIDRILKELTTQRSANASRIASTEAQIQMLNTHLADSGAFPKGARQLMDSANPLGIERQQILGTLADVVEAQADFRIALEAALRFWVNAVVVTDLPYALTLARTLETAKAGAAQLLAVEIAANPTSHAKLNSETVVPGINLLAHVTCQPAVRPLMERLLGNVRVLDSLDALPSPLPSDIVFVTRAGAIVGGNVVEYGYGRSGRQADSPLARKHALSELQEAIVALRSAEKTMDDQLAEATAHAATNDTAVLQARHDLDLKKRALALQEGECQIVSKEADQHREHLETVRFEFQQLEQQGSSVEDKSAINIEMDRSRARKVEIKLILDNQNVELHRLEQDHKTLQAEMLQSNVRLATQKQQRKHLQDQHDPLTERIAKQESRIAESVARITAYRNDIEALARAVDEAHQSIPALEGQIKSTGARLEDIRKQRSTAETEWNTAEARLNSLRDSLDQRRNQRSEINGTCIELRMKRQNLSDRIASEYRIPVDAIQLEPEPEWPPEGKPDAETLENTIGELRAKIEAMGPIYEGAIEEYEQLQERFTFLNQQQDDLVKSKQQLMDMIRKINQTTVELFAKTFDMINTNFQSTFKQLFGGGSAKLMLADDEDVLESGIEIIARPPGKRLQSVSLLSGGERTMTAVALLFAIFMVKPSPFCVLDELDAALDEPNNRRFIKMLEGFLRQSQFIIITHNQQTIAAASVIYGVTMPETGISRIVSMKFKKNEAQPALDSDEPKSGVESEAPDHSGLESDTGVNPAAQAEPVTEQASITAAYPAGELTTNSTGQSSGGPTENTSPTPASE